MKKLIIFICVLLAVNIAFAGMDEEPVSNSVKKKTKTAEKSAAGEKPSVKDDGTKINISGILETGVDVISRVNRDANEIRPLARGEIEISARPVKGVRAEIGIEYNRRDTFVTVDKFFGQYNITNNSSVRAGIMKKAFGLEERAGLDKRYFRSRSIVNAALEDEGFLEHDLTLQYRREEGANWRFIGGFSMSASEMNSGTRSTDTLRYFQNYSAHYRGSNIDIIGAAVIQHFHFVPRKWYTTAFAGSISCKRSISVWVSEAELTFGSSLNAKVIQDRDALIFGVRKQEQFPINTGLKILRQVTPLIEAASYWYDLEESGNFDTQIRGGVTLGFAKNNALQLRNTFGTILRMQEKETNVRRYRFDSEVVVIF